MLRLFCPPEFLGNTLEVKVFIFVRDNTPEVIYSGTIIILTRVAIATIDFFKSATAIFTIVDLIIN